MERPSGNVSPALSTCQRLKDKLNNVENDLSKNKFFARTRTPEQLENEKKALGLLSNKVADLEKALDACYSMAAFNDKEKTSILSTMDAARRDILAAAREIGPHVHVAKDVVDSVVSFARLKHVPDVITPRNFGLEWKTPAKTSENRTLDRQEDTLKLSQNQMLGKALKPVPVASAAAAEAKPLREFPSVAESPNHAGAVKSQRSAAIMQLQAKSKAALGSPAVVSQMTPTAATARSTSITRNDLPAAPSETEPVLSKNIDLASHENKAVEDQKPVKDQSVDNLSKTDPAQGIESHLSIDSCMCNIESIQVQPGDTVDAPVSGNIQDVVSKDMSTKALVESENLKEQGSSSGMVTSAADHEMPSKTPTSVVESAEDVEPMACLIRDESHSYMTLAQRIAQQAPAGTCKRPLDLEEATLSTPKRSIGNPQQQQPRQSLPPLGPVSRQTTYVQPGPLVSAFRTSQQSVMPKSVAWQPDVADVVAQASRRRTAPGSTQRLETELVPPTWRQSLDNCNQAPSGYKGHLHSLPGSYADVLPHHSYDLPASVAAVLPAMQELGLAGSWGGSTTDGPASICLEYDYDYEPYMGRGSGAAMPQRKRGVFGRVAAAVGTAIGITVVSVGAAFAAAALNAGLDELDHKPSNDQQKLKSGSARKGSRGTRSACPDIMLGRG